MNIFYLHEDPIEISEMMISTTSKLLDDVVYSPSCYRWCEYADQHEIRQHTRTILVLYGLALQMKTILAL